MDKLWTVLLLMLYFTGLYAMGKITVELFKTVIGAFKK